MDVEKVSLFANHCTTTKKIWVGNEALDASQRFEEQQKLPGRKGCCESPNVWVHVRNILLQFARRIFIVMMRDLVIYFWIMLKDSLCHFFWQKIVDDSVFERDRFFKIISVLNRQLGKPVFSKHEQNRVERCVILTLFLCIRHNFLL